MQITVIATEIPLDDREVSELFHGTDILGIKPEDIDGCKLGCLGIPEFEQTLLSRWWKIRSPRHSLT